MTAYATLTREFISPSKTPEGETPFIWFAEKDNFNDATLVLNNAYMKSQVYQKAKEYVRIRKITVIYTGQVGSRVQGAIVVGTDAVTYTPWPISLQISQFSGDYLEWDFGEGVVITVNEVIAKVNVLVLSMSGYAATDDVDVQVEGAFR